MPTIADIASALEAFAPLHLQEDYDNAGLLVGDSGRECTGVLLTVDVNPDIVREAVTAGCNLIVSHHPLIFRGLKHLTGTSKVEKAVIDAIRSDVAIYAAHTNLDNATGGVSAEMAGMLGLVDVSPLQSIAGEPDTVGCGAIGRLATPLSAYELVQKVKSTFGSPIARCDEFDTTRTITSVALCGGSGAFLIPEAIKAGAEAFVTSDVKYHDFVDYAGRILIVDIGHHESENCSKNIFYHIITEKFPNFAVRYSQSDTNPIIYL
ncbi:MAG: Nif3-like dinuclear metal center hexameric protein [Paramuribaculum sp.]|nr:Nif3-like dinuclear metal center hexameric protein [Paramuribaculum sp.]